MVSIHGYDFYELWVAICQVDPETKQQWGTEHSRNCGVLQNRWWLLCLGRLSTLSLCPFWTGIQLMLTGTCTTLCLRPARNGSSATRREVLREPMLQYANTFAHTATAIMDFSATNGVQLVPDPPYSLATPLPIQLVSIPIHQKAATKNQVGECGNSTLSKS